MSTQISPREHSVKDSPPRSPSRLRSRSGSRSSSQSPNRQSSRSLMRHVPKPRPTGDSYRPYRQRSPSPLRSGDRRRGLRHRRSRSRRSDGRELSEGEIDSQEMSPLSSVTPSPSPRRSRHYRSHRRRTRSRSRSRPRSPPAKRPDIMGGGAYIPPAKLRMMQQQITDRTSEAYQRLSWETLKKRINGTINKVNTANIKFIIPELLGENLVRGRGLLVRSLMKAQAASPSFTPVYAALVATINTKLPMVGELLVHRLVLQFRRVFRQNNKPLCLATTSFIAHLTNQRMVNEILAFQILQLLFENPTDDSVEVAIGFLKECGAYLSDIAPRVTNSMFDILRTILHEAEVDQRVQYMIEVLFQIRKNQFKEYPPIPEDLDLVEEDDQIVHEVLLDDDSLVTQDQLNVFRVDPEYIENEEKYRRFRHEVLGDSDDDSSGDSGTSGSEASGSGSESDASTDADEEDAAPSSAAAAQAQAIVDHTGADLVTLRRTIYLTIMSSANFEECAHKLMMLKLQKGEQEVELAKMIIECCAQERTYLKFYGLLGERFCKLSRSWALSFEQCFVETYETIHRYETNRLRNIAKYFAHLFATDALPWPALSIITLTEEGTTSSSRIFIKILLLELTEALGLPRVNDRLKDPEFHEAFRGLFPTDNPKNTRFAVNYFSSIGLGALTVELREHLKQASQRLLDQLGNPHSDSDASSSESSSGYSDSDSSTDSDSGSDTSSTRSTDSDSDSDVSSRSSRSRLRAHRRTRSPTPVRSRKRARSRSRESYRRTEARGYRSERDHSRRYRDRRPRSRTRSRS
ncbi:pre-mRNA-splicing factor cwc22 [Dispira parvispora]|uniref:Pre-mRNA-splicing factor cwc22 n=1 Tax=Dispira parvispora TaxID=1520584 RepID=A0A9W8AUS5_9FUNG|nr:pre-mRNA-splicing factor cwc22 [Dispira parvispora]